ncbi:MAG: class F sortase [Candidatus Dormibacteraeota bacterium]|nr:class F sortase [Candidatus Dormibacteraeota bacterium]
MKRPLIAVAAMFALAACGANGTAQKTAQNHPGQPSAKPSATASGSRHVPFTLSIKAIGVDTTVEQVGVDRYGNMAIPADPHNVGWYGPGSAPGQHGNAVIDGHLDWYGMPQGPFYRLNALKAGDEIDIGALDGTTFAFKVTAPASTVAYNSKPSGLFRTTGDPTLTLITCGGDWDASRQTYTQRQLLDATFVSEHQP